MNTTLLVIGYVWPEPNSSAAGRHMLSLLCVFRSQGWRVIFATPSQATDHMIDLNDYQIESQQIQLNDSSFDQFISELNPDIVLFDRFMMEEQFAWRVEKNCPNAMRILDTEDLQCLRNARHTALKENREMLPADLFSSDLAKREIAAILRCDLSLIISDFEMQLLRQQFNVDAALIQHLPFMLNLTEKPDFIAFEQRQHFVTIGNFRHAPNWDSVLYLQSIWPIIRSKLPTAELHIYGSYPPKKATELNNPKIGFLVNGWAEDAFEVLANARVCLAPLRFGAGIKGKLIDAMQVGTPSVTTNIGAEGMHANFPWPGIVANCVDTLADAAVALYEDKTLWDHSQQQIWPLLTEKYRSSVLSKGLIDRIQDIRSRIAEHRTTNFTGAMLRHHSMKSTQYLSKWIETKNRLESLY